MNKRLLLCLLAFPLSFSIFAEEKPQLDDWSGTILTFYKAYITNRGNDSKVDSLLTQYCTTKLKNAVKEALDKDDYDFLLDGCGGANIDGESVSVVKQGVRYKASFIVTKYPAGSGTDTITLKVLVNNSGKISSIIRPTDNYHVP